MNNVFSRLKNDIRSQTTVRIPENEDSGAVLLPIDVKHTEKIERNQDRREKRGMKNKNVDM